MQATQTISSDEQATQPLPVSGELPQRKEIDRMNIQTERANRYAWTWRWRVLAAAVIAVLVVGSLVAVLQMARTNNSSGGASVGSGKQSTTAKKPAPPATYPGMYLGVGNQVVK